MNEEELKELDAVLKEWHGAQHSWDGARQHHAGHLIIDFIDKVAGKAGTVVYCPYSYTNTKGYLISGFRCEHRGPDGICTRKKIMLIPGDEYGEHECDRLDSVANNDIDTSNWVRKDLHGGC